MSDLVRVENESLRLARCSRCGLESEVEAAFSKGWFGRRLCPDCLEKQHRRNTLVNYLMLPVLGLLLYRIPATNLLGWFFLQVSAVLFLNIPLIVLHELAHAGTANLLGLKAFLIVIGTGKPLFSKRLFGLYWELRPFPWGGVTAIGGLPQQGFRLKLVLTFLAGPLLHLVLLVLIGLIWLVVSFAGGNFWLLKLVDLAFLANLLILVSNLWPRKLASTAGLMGTDTWNLLRLFKMGSEEFERIHSDYYFLESWTAYQAGEMDAAWDWVNKGLAAYPGQLALQNMRGVIATQRDDYAAAWETFNAILRKLDDQPASQPEAGVGFRYLILNNVAFTGLMLEDESLLTLVDEYSRAAYSHMPWQSAIAGTRGAVLVVLGNPQEGLPLLRVALSQNSQPRDKALNTCFIALGEAALWNLEKAQKYLDQAQTWNPDCPLMERTQAMITEKRKAAGRA